uniref:Dienelactone hydrolase domain-containing protein n=1 Tax=Bionectria ochroleuca TaxID=29856 RepID=A0A8H7KCC3_BIOOC
MPPYDPSQQSNAVRRSQHDQSAITIEGKTLRYAAFTIGEAPPRGHPLYIALHGGGGAPAHVNDEAWEGMKDYYRSSVQKGVYVAVRGITNTWDLHFQAESYMLLERLIENMILFANVDSDRVYLLGYSAGGDGVYQLSPRLADRLAAVNMSAGHHNWVSLANMASTPICLQMGERDGAYNRNSATAEMGETLDVLAEVNRGQYHHQVFIHKGRPHGFVDNDPQRSLYPVLDSPQRWLKEGDTSAHLADTNAVEWVSQFMRNALPSRVVWDLTTRATRTSRGLWYWLDIGDETAESLGTEVIVARLDATSNGVAIEKARTILRILLNDEMLDLDRPIQVSVGRQDLEVQVRRDEELQVATLAQRCDPRWVFSAAIDLVQDADGWHILPQ